MEIGPGHLVCIVGGGIAGSEASERLTARGIRTIVFDQGALPWGKIELGLPKWHAKQRDQEEASIDEKMRHPLAEYVPCTRVGWDLSIEEIVNWGVSAVLLAVGAWQDRPLAVPGIDDFVGRGFYYQNPFVSWFNQYHDPGYAGPQLEIADDAIVVGGGLASIDVVKILMIETTMRALTARGLSADLFTLEKKGIPQTLEKLGVSWESLGLKGCSLYYRRGPQHMPLIPLDEDPPPERLVQAERVREKLLQHARDKYLFRFKPFSVPVEKLLEGDRLAGLVFRRTEVQDGRVREIPDSEFEVRSGLIISSIGSIPEAIPGLTLDRELYAMEDSTACRLKGFRNVFALGNAVTGRGNIRASRVHGREVSEWVMDHFLSWNPDDAERFEQLASAKDAGLEAFCRKKQLLSADRIREILYRVHELQSRVHYDGDYTLWLQERRPVRLEQL